MYIDGDTHYWPVRFLERVKHPGRGYIEFQKGAGDDDSLWREISRRRGDLLSRR